MNGVIGEVGINSQEAADHRHEPVVNRVQLVADHEDVEVGELLFEGSAGAVSAEDAESAKTAAANGTKTAFDFDFGEVLPGTVIITTDDTTAKTVSDNGDGTLGGEAEDGTGTVDYSTGKVSVTFSAAPADTKTVTAKAVKGSGFVGVANDTVGKDEDNGVNVVIHGTIHEGIAKVNGFAATSEQLKFLARHGIY